MERFTADCSSFPLPGGHFGVRFSVRDRLMPSGVSSVGPTPRNESGNLRFGLEPVATYIRMAESVCGCNLKNEGVVRPELRIVRPICASGRVRNQRNRNRVSSCDGIRDNS